MKKVVCILFCLVVFCSGCNRTEMEFGSTRVLRITEASEQAVLLSSVVASLKFIPLETDSILLPGSLSMVIKNDCMLAYNSMAKDVRPVLFSTSGRFMGRPGRTGNGPNEIQPGFFHLTRVFIDDAARTVEYAQQGCIYRFTFDGRFIEKCMIGGNIKDQLTDTALLNRFVPRYVDLHSCGRNVVAMFGQKIFVSTDGGLHFSVEVGTACPDIIIFDDKLGVGVTQTKWNVHDDYIALFDFATGDYKHFYYDGRTSVPFSIESPAGFAAPTNSPTLVSRLAETSRYLIFDAGDRLTGEYQEHSYLYDKKMNELVRLKKPDAEKSSVFVNDLYPGIDLNLNRGTEDGRLYQVIDAADFREQAFACGDANLRALAAGMKDDDNQVVVLAEMKE